MSERVFDITLKTTCDDEIHRPPELWDWDAAAPPGAKIELNGLARTRKGVPYVPWWLPIAPAVILILEAVHMDPEWGLARDVFALMGAFMVLVSGVGWERYVNQESLRERMKRLKRERADAKPSEAPGT